MALLGSGALVWPGTAFIVGMGLQLYSPMQEAVRGVSLPVLLAVQAACDKQHVEFSVDQVNGAMNFALRSAPADIAVATTVYFRQGLCIEKCLNTLAEGRFVDSGELRRILGAMATRLPYRWQYAGRAGNGGARVVASVLRELTDDSAMLAAAQLRFRCDMLPESVATVLSFLIVLRVLGRRER